MLSGVSSRMPPMQRWRKRFYTENFLAEMMRVSRLHLSNRPMHCHYGPDGLVFQLMVPEGPLICWCLVRISSQWSGSGLRRMIRLMIKKFLGHSLTTGGPSTKGTLSSRTCAIFTLTASACGRDGMHMRNHDFDETAKLI